MPRYLYLDDVRFAVLDLSRAPAMARSRVRLELAAELGHTTDPFGELARHQVDGLILGLNRGWAGRSHFRLLEQAKARGFPAWFYFTREEAIEFIDGPRKKLHLRVAALARLYSMYRRRSLGSSEPGEEVPQPPPSAGAAPRDLAIPSGGKVPGRALYVRLDGWARFESGGSYGHTCHVARALARRTESLLALLPHRYAMLDDFGVRQVVLTTPDAQASEADLILANRHYYPILKTAFEMERPAYVYERLVLGSFVVARLCRELGIPFIAEYNGSEISMGRGFGSTRYAYERDLLRIEDFDFRQATLIVVVSKHVKADLVNRGVDPARILVNPNGADPTMYAPPAPPERDTLRASLGFRREDRVVGFCGTFGVWHGIDVLAAAIPRICEAEASSRFLLIGDGNEKHLVDAAVEKHHLSNRVVRVGRTSQIDGARYQGACDLLVSPHSRNMVDSPFFGSPTKLFEYMGFGVGIVASDLEQIGEVLSPALPSSAIGVKPVTTERAILCKPGDVDEFVQGVIGLVRNESVSRALGANARQALLDHFTWSANVERIWQALRGNAAPVPGISYGDPQAALSSGGAELVPGESDDLLAGLADEASGKPARLLAYAIVNPTALAPLKTSTAEILIVEPWGRNWTAFLRESGLKARVVYGNFDSVSAEGGFDALVSERGFDFGESPKYLLETAHRFVVPGGTLRARVRLNSSMHFWKQVVILEGLARKGLGHYSPDEVVGRDETPMPPHLVARTFAAAEITKLARGYGDSRLRRRGGLHADLTVRFPGARG